MQLNPDKSEAIIFGTAAQLKKFSSLQSVSVAGASVSVLDSVKIVGVTLEKHLTFDPFHVRSLEFQKYFFDVFRF